MARSGSGGVERVKRGFTWITYVLKEVSDVVDLAFHNYPSRVLCKQRSTASEGMSESKNEVVR